MKKPKKALNIWEKVRKRQKAQNFSKKPLLFFEGRKRPNWPEKAHHGNTGWSKKLVNRRCRINFLNSNFNFNFFQFIFNCFLTIFPVVLLVAKLT